jgi:hypothetical protein
MNYLRRSHAPISRIDDQVTFCHHLDLVDRLLLFHKNSMLRSDSPYPDSSNRAFINQKNGRPLFLLSSMSEDPTIDHPYC